MPTFAFDAIGTRWRISYILPPQVDDEQIRSAISSEIETFDQSFSRFRADSWICHIRENPGTYELPPHAHDLLTLYKRAYDVSDGFVTPLIGTTMEQAGYDAAYSLTPQELTPVPAFDTAVTFTGTAMTTNARVLLDFGAAGKGYLIDLIAALLQSAGITTFTVDAGGDIRHMDADGSTLTIGLENPFDLSQAIGTCELGDGSLCASAGSRRAWEGYTHIINPRTLSSKTDVAAVWTKARTAAVADMVATILYFVPPQKAAQLFDFDYAILHSDMQLTASNNFKVSAFTGAQS